MTSRDTLIINEIFYSIQGESTQMGKPCVFVRLTACDLRCAWCDTPYAFEDGAEMTIDAIIQRVKEYGCNLVEVTGVLWACCALCGVRRSLGSYVTTSRGMARPAEVRPRALREPTGAFWPNVKTDQGHPPAVQFSHIAQRLAYQGAVPQVVFLLKPAIKGRTLCLANQANRDPFQCVNFIPKIGQ